MSPPLDIDALLVQEKWVKTLALQLMRDEAAAEDLAQEAWLVVLQRTRAGVRQSSLWLDGIVRNLAMRKWAADRSRPDHGALPADDASRHGEALLGPQELLEREAWRRRLLEMVVALDPIYRDVLIGHYLQGIAGEKLAGQLGLPVNTVWTRLKRGRELLRERINREDGGEVWGANSMWFGLAMAWGTPSLKRELGRKLASKPASGPAPEGSPSQLAEASPTASLGASIAPWVVGALATLVVGSVILLGSDDKTPREPARAVTAADSLLKAFPSTGQGVRAAVAPRPADAVGVDSAWTIETRLRAGELPSGHLPAVEVPLRMTAYAGAGVQGEPLAKLELVSDHDGRITWPLAEPEGTFTVVVECLNDAWSVPASKEPIVVAATRAPGVAVEFDWTVFALDRPISMTIRDQQGLPIAGARARCNESSGVADAGGRVSLRTSSGYAWHHVEVCAEGYGSKKQRLVLDPGPDALELVYALGPAVTVHGLVLDDGLQPVPGASVTWPGSELALVLSDADGLFEFPYADTSALRMLSVFKRGHIARTYSLVWPNERNVVYLPRRMMVTGRVLAADARPGAGARVEALLRDTIIDASYADANGAFSISAASFAPVTLRVRADGCARTLKSMAAPVGSSVWPAGVIQLDAGRTLRGRVVDGAGKPVPIAFAIVQAENLEMSDGALTDADGWFELRHVPTRAGLELHVRAPGFLPQSWRLDLEAAQELYQLTQPGAWVGGSVRDRQTGEPISEYTVRLARASAMEELRCFSSDWRSDVSICPWVPGALVTAIVERDGFVPCVRELVASPQAAADGLPLFELERATRLVGFVQDERGEPIAGARIEPELPPLVAAECATLTDASGRFVSLWLEASGVALRVSAEGYATVEGWTPAADGHEVRLSPAPGLGGRLFAADGSAAAYAPFVVYQTGQRRRATIYEGQTGAGGEFQVGGLGTGVYNVALWDARFQGAEVETLAWSVHLREGERARHDFRVPQTESCTLTGVVVNDSKLRFYSTTVVAYLAPPGRETEDSPSRPVLERVAARVLADDGAFTLHGVPAGSVKVSAHADSLGRDQQIRHSIEIELAPRSVTDVSLRLR